MFSHLECVDSTLSLSLSARVVRVLVTAQREMTDTVSQALNLTSVAVQPASLPSPLHYGFNVAVNPHILDWQRGSFFSMYPPSMATSLVLVSSKKFSISWNRHISTVMSPTKDREKPLFLTALASDLKSIQLHALTR